MSKKKYEPRHENKKGFLSSVIPWIIMLIIFIASAIGGAIFASSSLFDDPHERRRESIKIENSPRAETLLVAKDKATVMIMGVDERADDIGRSDTLMLATVDPKKKEASLLSIPRDTRVYVPGYGYDKINVAYSLGGWKLTRDTVEELLDTPIDHYVKINTRSFPRIIDAIGGVDIFVESRMEYVDEWDDAVPGGLVIDLYPGMQHMDGVTAMSYVRYRDEEGDIGRIARQQKFMQAVMNQIFSPSIIVRLPSIIKETLSSVETDLSFRELVELAGAVKESQSSGLKTSMVEGYPLYIDEISYWIPDIAEARTSFASTLGIQMSDAARSEIERDRNEMQSSIPSTAVPVPESDTSIGRTPRERINANQNSLRPSVIPTPTQPSTSSRNKDKDNKNADDEDETTTKPSNMSTQNTPNTQNNQSSSSTGSSDSSGKQTSSSTGDDKNDENNEKDDASSFVPPHETVTRPSAPTPPTKPTSPSSLPSGKNQ